MATTVKEKGPGSSSSVTDKMKKTTSQAKKTPAKSSPLSSSSDQKPQKPIPNYLKPTISSSHISTKPAVTTTTSVPTRRSHPVEKPPLPAQAHKAVLPKPNAPQRSVSSLSSKPSKTGSVPTMRRSISAKGSSSTKKVATKKGASQPESRVDDHDVACDKAPLDHVDGGEVEEVAHNDEQQAVQSDQDPGKEQADEQTLEKAQEEVEEESPVVDHKDEKDGFGLVEDQVDEEKVVEEKDETVDAPTEGSKEEEQETKQAEPGKEAQDYNDVIEETATKLMEDNTNKVRALAGAFETVISLQDTK